MPPSPYAGSCSTSRSSRAALASTRVGAQPSSVQVPPGRSRSTSATRAPSSAARSAAVVPAGPPPMTIRSKRSTRVAYRDDNSAADTRRKPGPTTATNELATMTLMPSDHEMDVPVITWTPGVRRLRAIYERSASMVGSSSVYDYSVEEDASAPRPLTSIRRITPVDPGDVTPADPERVRRRHRPRRHARVQRWGPLARGRIRRLGRLVARRPYLRRLPDRQFKDHSGAGRGPCRELVRYRDLGHHARPGRASRLGGHTGAVSYRRISCLRKSMYRARTRHHP